MTTPKPHVCALCGTTHRLLVYRRLPMEHWICAVCVGEHVPTGWWRP